MLLVYSALQLNLASQSVLEGLNACFDHRGEVSITSLFQCDIVIRLVSYSTFVSQYCIVLVVYVGWAKFLNIDTVIDWKFSSFLCFHPEIGPLLSY